MNDGTAGPIFIRSAIAGELREERERSRIENSVGVLKDEASSENMPGDARETTYRREFSVSAARPLTPRRCPDAGSGRGKTAERSDKGKCRDC